MTEGVLDSEEEEEFDDEEILHVLSSLQAKPMSYSISKQDGGVEVFWNNGRTCVRTDPCFLSCVHDGNAINCSGQCEYDEQNKIQRMASHETLEC